MELVIASETKLYRQGNVDSTVLVQSVIRVMLLEWQSEVFFLKKKAIAIIQFMGLGYVSEKCLGHKKAHFKRELLGFVEEAFAFFQKKIEKQLDRWSAVLIAEGNPLEVELEEIQAMQQEWQGLKQKFRQVEMRIMQGLFQHYPIKII